MSCSTPQARCATSAALAISGIPFNGPIGAARVGYVNGKYLLNPTKTELQTSELDLVVAGTASAETIGVSMQSFDNNFQTLLRHGITERELELLQGGAGTPGIIGANDTIYRQIGTKQDNKTYRKFPLMRFEQDYKALPRETYARLLQKLNVRSRTQLAVHVWQKSPR